MAVPSARACSTSCRCDIAAPGSARRSAGSHARRPLASTEGTAVGLTGGTTTTEIARALVRVPRLTVVTNSLSIASELAVRPNLKLVVTGGVARAESL